MFIDNMPKSAIDYNNTIIYKILSKDNSIKYIYIGHTTNLKRRIIQHRYNCNHLDNNAYNYKLYSFIRDNGGFDNFEILIVEKFNCKSQIEAITRERYWYDYYSDYTRLNGNIPNRNPTERRRDYRRENRNNCIEKEKVYNKSEKRKEYYKKYREENKEKNNEYYLMNKEKILNRMVVKVNCDICGLELLKCNLLRHKKNKHL